MRSVNAATAAHLIEVNRQFYQTFALQFDSTRQRLQPGVQRILAGLKTDLSILDLGCGNGAVARALAAATYSGCYIGLDFSAGLLGRAGILQPPAGFSVQFIDADLTAPEWQEVVPTPSYDLILLFAVLHHLPGAIVRQQLLSNAQRLLKPHGCLIHSEWQFMNSARLRARIQPWQSVGVQPEQVDSGDFLLDWRQGGNGLRYVHDFNESELADLARQTGFKVQETFYSDGENQRLGLYQIWQPS
jgi:tRNA (uracil-5-)-methyltransferase TRM9